MRHAADRRRVARPQHEQHDDAHRDPARHRVRRVGVRRREGRDEREPGHPGDAGGAHKAGQQQQRADDRHDEVRDPAALFAAVPRVVPDTGDVGDDVDGHDHHDDRRADHAEGDLRRVVEAQGEGHGQADQQLDDHPHAG